MGVLSLLVAAGGIWQEFLTAFSLPFMQRALLTITVLAIVAGFVGLFISFRELEFVSDGLVHAVFPGLVVGAMLGAAWVLPGALLAAVLGAVLFTVLARRGVGNDATIAVVLTGLFSLGVVLVSRQKSYVSQLQELLFGRLLTVTDMQLVQISIVGVIALALVFVLRRSQLFRAFDSAGARAAGFNILRGDVLLGVAVAMLVVAGVQALGVLMVIALLVVPMASARLVTNRLAVMILLAVVLPFLAGVLGLYASFSWSVASGLTIAPGALIVFFLLAGFGVAVIFGSVRRLVLARRQLVAAEAGGDSRAVLEQQPCPQNPAPGQAPTQAQTCGGSAG